MWKTNLTLSLSLDHRCQIYEAEQKDFIYYRLAKSNLTNASDFARIARI
jgi:hypothetical protein